MKTYKRTVSPERAAQLRRIFTDSGARFRQLGDTRVTGYNYKLVVYSRRGGNEWSPARNVEQFTVYYN